VAARGQVDVTDYFKPVHHLPMLVFTCLIQQLRPAVPPYGRQPGRAQGRPRGRQRDRPVYSALYEISLEVFEDGKPVASRYGRWHAGAEGYRETNRKDDLRWHRFELDLEPGRIRPGGWNSRT
jgi:hypothetical protein